MINAHIVDGSLRYCCEDISLIENYSLAINDTEMWELHHRLETHDENGNVRDKPLTHNELKAMNLYLHRPASELIFIKQKKHKILHMVGNTHAKGKNIGNQYAKGNVLSKEVRKRMGESRKGNTNNGIALIRCIETDEVMRTREWIAKGFKNAYAVAKGRQKSCHGYHFEYIKGRIKNE